MTIEKEIHIGGSIDQKSFELLFRNFFPALMTFAGKFLSNEDDAREVVHMVFINLWEKRETLDLSSSLKSYLFTSVHHRSLNMIRDRKKFLGNEIPDLSSDHDIGASVDAMELEERIREVIKGLPEKCREVFEMSRFEGLRYAEIAERLNISVKTVENQMSKALKILREKLVNYLALLVWLVWNGLN
jgi:RNA polymerase sigma-70 factor, ECF subfamily